MPVLLGEASDVEHHLELGKQLLGAGQFADALTHYHAAIDADPNNYMSYYRRATVYLALGKSKSALPDLSQVLVLKPDFTAARLQRAKVYTKQGTYVTRYIQNVQRDSPSDPDAATGLESILPLYEKIDDARDALDNGEYGRAADLFTDVIEICPWDSDLHERRAETYMALGDYQKAIADLRPAAKLRPDNTDARYKLSSLHYNLGDAEESLNEIRECLKLDPDHKTCHDHYKRVKKLDKQIKQAQEARNSGQYEDCIDRANAMSRTETGVAAFMLQTNQFLCHCYAKLAGSNRGDDADAGITAADEAVDSCNAVLKQNEWDVDALCDRAEAHISNDDFDAAIADYKAALDIDSQFQRASEGQQRAQKLLKQSQKRDYYKILGVKRTAHKREINRAYRQLAMKWHPDNFPADDKKREEATKKFIDIAAAKEVLTDPEKRQKFDNGEDPLDAEEQAGGGGGWHHHHPFDGFQGFQGFQGGNFKFHFG